MTARWIANRAASAVTTLIAASVLMFVLLMIGPDPTALLAQESGGTVDVARIAADNGWDQPWMVQYAHWASNFVHGDWGTSSRTGESARTLILDRFALTLGIGLSAIVLAMLLSVLLGTWAAYHKGSRRDDLSVAALVGLGAIPGFLLALLLQLIAVKIKDVTGVTVLYVSGTPRDGGMLEWVQRGVLPVLALSLWQVSAWVRYQRAELLEVLGRDFIAAAYGKGLPRRIVLARHALRCAISPLITLIALDLGHLVGGAVIVETVFSLPGIGRLLVDSVQARDIVVTLDIIAIGAIAMVAATAIADVVTARIDPRQTVEHHTT